MASRNVTPPETDYSKFDSLNCRESRLVWDYFHRRKEGVYVDVGANHPTEQSLTWFLELQGWRGVLIEPNPAFYKLLRERRPRSRTFQLAVGSPEDTGVAQLHLAVGHGQSTIKPEFDAELSGERIQVEMRTLNSVLAEAGVDRVDFLSLDVEGTELDVLRGLDLERYRPELILLEDHLHHYGKHTYLRARGYKLVRRTGYNNWYVPRNAPATVFSVSSAGEVWNLVRKMWLSYPLIRMRRALKKARLRNQVAAPSRRNRSAR